MIYLVVKFKSKGLIVCSDLAKLLVCLTWEKQILSSRAWLLLLSLSLIWGASFYFIEIGLIYLDPFWLVSVRLISGALALVLWLALNKIDLPNDGQFWLATAIMGVFNNVIPFILIAYGQQYVTGGLASIINANTAFISIIVSGIFVASEPAKWHRIVGVLIGICGIAIAIGIDDTNPHKTGTSELIGELAIVLATVSYAFAAVWGKLRLTQYKPIQGATGMLICSAVVAIFCSLLISGPPEFTITDHPIDLFKLIVGIDVNRKDRPKDFLAHRFIVRVLTENGCWSNKVTCGIIVSASSHNCTSCIGLCPVNVSGDGIEGFSVNDG